MPLSNMDLIMFSLLGSNFVDEYHAILSLPNVDQATVGQFDEDLAESGYVT